jgi:hypothetical protein
VSFAAITLCVVSQRVFVVVVLLSTQSGNVWIHPHIIRHRFKFRGMGINTELECAVTEVACPLL